MEDSTEADIFYSEFQLRGGKTFRTEKDPCALKEIHGWTGLASSNGVGKGRWSSLELSRTGFGECRSWAKFAHVYKCVAAVKGRSLKKFQQCAAQSPAIPDTWFW